MTDARIVEDYIDRVLKLQVSREEQLSTDDLRAIAAELGASEDDLDAVQREGMRRLETGLAKFHGGRFAHAISDLEEASALCPGNTEALYALAMTLWARYCRAGVANDRTRAKEVCDRGLDADSEHLPLRALLHATNQGRPATPSSGWRGAGLGLLGLAVGAGGSWTLLSQNAPGPAEPIQPLPVAAASLVSPASAPAPGSDSSATPSTDGSLPVEFVPGQNGAGLELTIRKNELRNHTDQSFFQLNAEVRNGTWNKEVAQLKFRMEILDSTGSMVGNPRIFEAKRSYGPTLRPSDITVFANLERTTPLAHHVRLSVASIELQPAASKYPAARKLPLTWQPGVRPVALHVAERDVSMNDHGSDETAHTADLEVRNDSERAITGLKLQFKYLAADGILLAKDESYVVASGPSLLPGQTRTLGALEIFEGKLHHYTVTVLELEH